MEQKIRVFLADASPDQLEMLSTAMAEQPDFSLAGRAERGDTALELLRELRPDVLVMDTLLPGLDGLSLLRRLKSEGKMPRTMIFSAFVSDRLAYAASHLGVDDYLSKPCDTAILLRRVRELSRPIRRDTGRNEDSEYAVRRALFHFGINSHLSGYRYLVEGICRALEDRNVLHGITKILYPDLARHFCTKPVCIERSMRSAVEKGWNNTTPERRRAYFGDIFDAFETCPSNIPFITAIADFIEMNTAWDDIVGIR